MHKDNPIVQMFKDVNGIVRISKYDTNKKFIQAHHLPCDKISSFPQQKSLEQHIYFQPFSRKAMNGRKESSCSTKVLWVDIDRHVLPSSYEIHPSYIINSGNGYHLYWLLKTPITVHYQGNTEKVFENALKQLSKEYGGDISTTHTAASMRLPGSFNVKDKSNPKHVLWESFGFEYSPSIINELSKKYIASNGIKKNNDRPKRKIRNITPHINSLSIIDECAAINYAYNNANNISEPEWFNILRTVVALPDGMMVAHQISQHHQNYSEEETFNKALHAKNYKPASCASLECIGQCSGCSWQGLTKSPAGIPYKKLKKAA